MSRRQSGQGGLMFVLVTGSLLAVIVFFGWYKQRMVTAVAERVENSLIAQEVTSAVAQRVQKIYAEESGCDPDLLDERLSNLNELSLTSTVPYAVAVTQATSLSKERLGICTGSGGKGCRQLTVDVEGRRYVATVGKISGTAGVSCPRDATVRIRTTIEDNLYTRRVTLINTCSYKSCSGGTFDTAESLVGTNPIVTTACASLPARKYGALTQATDTAVNSDDLRFARRYLSTGAGDSGDTTFLTGAVNVSPCAAGTGGCLVTSCIPGLDLNRDGTNNEADLAILEYYLRGFIPELPVRSF